MQADQEDVAAAAQARQELQEAWQDLTTTVSSLFIPTSSSNSSSSSSSSEGTGDTPSTTTSSSSRAQSPAPLPQVLGRLFSGRFLSEARQLEQQWQGGGNTQWPASAAAAATGQGSGDGDDGVLRTRTPTTTTTTGSSSSSNQCFVDVPASQQVIDVEVDPQPPTPPPSSSSSSNGTASSGATTGSGAAAAAAAADPWLQTPTQTPPEPPPSAAVASDKEDAEAVPPSSQLLLLLPGTNILKYSVWGVWLASWLTVLPAVAAAVQVGEVGRVCWAMLLSYPGISPLVTHLAAVSASAGSPGVLHHPHRGRSRGRGETGHDWEPSSTQGGGNSHVSRHC